MVQLLFKEKPLISGMDLSKSLQEKGLDVSLLSQKTNEYPFVFIHNDAKILVEDKTINSQIVFVESDLQKLKPEYNAAIEQSWKFPDVSQTLPHCNASMLVTDMFAHKLPYLQRLELFRKSVAAILEITNPEAIYWIPTQQFIKPQDYLDAQSLPGFDWFFVGFVNVRMFNVQENPNDMVLDTRGLSEIGLTDLQCHFRDLDYQKMIPLLYNTAYYLFTSGNAINDGETIQGISPKDKWKCRHEMSLIPPERIVLDINPGKRYAAGNRN